jgi:iron-sulfur cluster assembly accessory protein
MEISPSVTPASPGTGAVECPVRLSERALEAVKQALREQKIDGHSLRVGLVPGGCAGFSYDMDVVLEAAPGDLKFEQGGVSILIDAKAVPLLKGTEVDYVQDGLRAGFSFSNPNARSSCGCGSSFQA